MLGPERLHEKFNDPMKAIYYLEMGLSDDYPCGVVEVVYHAGVRSRLQTCRVHDLTPLLERFCHKFPRASVYYDPKAADGQIAEIHCHCDEGVKLTCCTHGSRRPRVVLRLLDAGSRAPSKELVAGDSTEPRPSEAESGHYDPSHPHRPLEIVKGQWF